MSIIIVSWNTREILRNCLQSIRDQAGTVRFEMIVVDNGSADGSADMVADAFPTVRLIRNRNNVGFAAANNQGMEIATGRYVLLLNSDTIVLDGAIAKSVVFADKHPKAGIVGCRTTFPNGRHQYNCFLFPSLLNLALSLTRLNKLFRRHRFFGRYRLYWWDYAGERQVDGVAGCFMLARRSAIDRVGPMAEQYFMYAEDADWCWRMKRGGWQVWYTPDAHIHHLGDASGAQAATEMRVRYRQSILTFLTMKSGRLAARCANALFCAASLTQFPVIIIQRAIGRLNADAAAAEWKHAAAAIRFHLSGRLPS